MDKPKRFLECLLPVTICNLECHYCYVIQENRRTMKPLALKYSPEYIAKALNKKRLGGPCWISICGAGETLVPVECVEIVRLLLQEGHYVNITTNGTLSNRIDQLIAMCGENIKHLHFSFSFHYLELKRKRLLETFFSNIKKVRNAGASILLQMNLCDEYLPYLEEIKKISIEEVGGTPQLALTRDEYSRPMKIYSELPFSKYVEAGKDFDSPLFQFTCKNFNKKRKEFCYAGDWSGTLNLETGWLSRCYENSEGENIFEDISRPINFKAVGRNCKNCYCINSSHFMSLGVIPSINTPTYADLRNRKEAGWYSLEMLAFLSQKLEISNVQYSVLKKFLVDIENFSYTPYLKFRNLCKRLALRFPALYAVYKKIKKS